MTPRDAVLNRIRTGLGRGAGEVPPAPPAVRLRIPEAGLEDRIASFTARLEALAGRVHRVRTPSEAGGWIAAELGNRTAVASNNPYLEACGITHFPRVRSGITDREQLRETCASADVGVTGADYGLADTGTLVLLSSPEEARLISLLPPAHIAVLSCNRLITGLDELFTVVPTPASTSSSMVLITGPSRTADIEQILVRGVHGPGQITVVLVG